MKRGSSNESNFFAVGCSSSTIYMSEEVAFLLGNNYQLRRHRLSRPFNLSEIYSREMVCTMSSGRLFLWFKIKS